MGRGWSPRGSSLLTEGNGYSCENFQKDSMATAWTCWRNPKLTTSVFPAGLSGLQTQEEERRVSSQDTDKSYFFNPQGPYRKSPHPDLSIRVLLVWEGLALSQRPNSVEDGYAMRASFYYSHHAII